VTHRRITAAAVGLFVLSLLSTRPAAAADTLIVGDQKGLQKAVLEASGAADNLPYTLRWSEFEAASPLLQALGAGAIDTGIAGDGPFLFAWGAGLPVKAAFWLPPRAAGQQTAIVASAATSIASPKDLSGKRIATGRGSIGHLLLLRLIQTGAIPAPAPRIVFLSPAQAKASLDSGAVDAWSTWEPYVSLETVGAHGRVIVDGSAVLPNNSFFVATDAALAGKRALLEDFYRRLAKAYAWSRSHEDAYARLLARQTGLPPDIAGPVAHRMITSPAPVTPAVVQQEATTLDAYRGAGFLPDAPPIGSGFVTGLGAP